MRSLKPAPIRATIVACGQIRPLGDAFELASLFVEPELRGSGLGSSLVERLLDRHAEEGHGCDDVYLLTLQRTTGFYTRLGFVQIDVTEAPSPMQLEYSIGRQVASVFAGDSLAVMKCAGRSLTK
uniref:N-acetyltransferase domain-containing protein n=1 Tax=Lotharella globosa TaxID=91324 RepID=A0A6V3JBR6_9EUKA|mmetsp:Transcript_8578/g.16622  ORF Transcript_8578/g.16622 Transcript_8578/m.16622 type:complete len:125 (+) Transcript_8578:393-767(+)